MFAQLFTTLEDYENVEKFDENVKLTFEKMLSQFKEWIKDEEKLQDFIMENLLFTILGCFSLKDKFVVKIFGDGYIITENIRRMMSYIRLSYGAHPPYYAYKYCSFEGDEEFKNKNIKTFEFPKEAFKRVGVATDGVKAIAKGDIETQELKRMKDKKSCEAAIIANRYLLYDDLTLGIFDEGGI